MDVTTPSTVISQTTNATAVSPDPDSVLLILNIVIPIISLLTFFGTVIITYFVDDPGLKKLKRASEQAEPTNISEIDKNYVQYLAETKLGYQTKGHTFSSFSPGNYFSINAVTHLSEGNRPLSHARRRACSESHTGGRLSGVSSETQVILEHMLLPLGQGSSHSSLRSRPNIHVPFVRKWVRRSTDESDTVVVHESEKNPDKDAA